MPDYYKKVFVLDGKQSYRKGKKGYQVKSWFLAQNNLI